MSNPRYYLDDQKPVVIGHICSNCGNPVIQRPIVCGSLEKVLYEFFPNQGKEKAKAALEQGMRDEIDLIKNCATNETCLGDENNMETKPVERGMWRSTYIKNITDPCPNCKNVEKWQDKAQSKEIKIENYPILFETAEEADTWAREQIALQIVEINEKRNGADVKKTVEKVEELQKTLAFELAKVNKNPYYIRTKELISEQAKLQKEFSTCEPLAIKKKSQLKGQMKALNAESTELAPKIAEILNAYNRKKLESNVDQYELIAYGCTGDVKMQGSPEKAICYCAEANVPPEVKEKRVQLYEFFLNNDCESPEITRNKEDEEIINETIKNGKRFCQYCGQPIVPGARFCNSCGKEI